MRERQTLLSTPRFQHHLVPQVHWKQRLGRKKVPDTATMEMMKNTHLMLCLSLVVHGCVYGQVLIVDCGMTQESAPTCETDLLLPVVTVGSDSRQIDDFGQVWEKWTIMRSRKQAK